MKPTRWKDFKPGQIHDPESGKLYSSRRHLNDDGNLAMHGYIGVPLLGRTAIFQPISRGLLHIAQMLQ